jgi:hypothetical protein
MISFRESLDPLGAVDTSAPDIGDWIAAWPAVRRDLEALIDAYEQRRPGFHRQWTINVLDAVEDSLRDLEHRAAWLRAHLEAA